MGKKALFMVLAVAVCVSTVAAPSFGKEEAKTAAPLKQAPRPPFSMINGTIVKINAADPANVKIEVKNEADGTVHPISVTQMTNITKVTDISELKAGDAVRVFSKKSDGSEIAMGIMFGRLAARPIPKPAAPAAEKGANRAARK